MGKRKTGRKTRREIERLFSVARGIAETFGPNCEVVLHDLACPESSLVLVTGTVTGRQPGAPITDLVLETLRRDGDRAEDMIGYRVRTKDGRVLKASTIFIRNGKGKIVGCMCINYDLTVLEGAVKTLGLFCAPGSPDKVQRETFGVDVRQLVETVVEEAVKEIGMITPLQTKRETLRLLQLLEGRGLFRVKGAVDYVAQYLGLSKFTIYHYLRELRNGERS